VKRFHVYYLPVRVAVRAGQVTRPEGYANNRHGKERGYPCRFLLLPVYSVKICFV